MKCDDRKREMFSRRACSESGPHPGIPGGTGSGPGGGGGHLWGKRNQGRTSAPVVGHARAPAIILRTRRSWPVAPTHCRRQEFRKYHRFIISMMKRNFVSILNFATQIQILILTFYSLRRGVVFIICSMVFLNLGILSTILKSGSFKIHVLKRFIVNI